MKTYLDTQIYKQIFDEKLESANLVTSFLNDPEELEKQYKLFISGAVRNPTLTHPKLEKVALQELNSKIQKAYTKVESSELDVPTKTLYRILLRQREIINNILLATADNDAVNFMKFQWEYYGEINQELIDYSFYHFDNILKSKESLPELKSSVEFLRENVVIKYDRASAIKVENILKKEIPEELVKRVKQFIDIEYRAEKDNYTSEEMEVIVNQIINHRIGDKWVAEISRSHMRFTVSGWKRKVYIPANRTYSGKRFQRLIVHELGVHVLRMNNNRLNRKRSIQRQITTTREEGIATFVEDVYGFQNDYSANTILFLSLILGRDGKKRDFRDMFEIMKAYHLLNEADSDELGKQIWADLVKRFRGSDFNSAGICNLRTKVYAEDYYLVKQYLLTNPDEFERIMQMRYDFLDKEFTRLVGELYK